MFVGGGKISILKLTAMMKRKESALSDFILSVMIFLLSWSLQANKYIKY